MDHYIIQNESIHAFLLETSMSWRWVGFVGDRWAVWCFGTRPSVIPKIVCSCFCGKAQPIEACLWSDVFCHWKKYLGRRCVFYRVDELLLISKVSGERKNMECLVKEMECMGTIESQPEPLIEHLGKGPSQPWEHKWKLGSTSPRPHLKGWLPLGKDLWLGISPLWSFPCEPRSSETGEHFSF